MFRPSSISHLLAYQLSVVYARCAATRVKYGDRGVISVCYAGPSFPTIPASAAFCSGGSVKYQLLQRYFPHHASRCTILYAVSSSHSPVISTLITIARERGIRVIWNQNGAWVPFAYRADIVRAGNEAMSACLRSADYVIYQSKFAQNSSEYFCGRREGPSEILYNAVDTTEFRPSEGRRSSSILTVLTSGSHNDDYRLPLALQTIAMVKKSRKVKLLIAGRIPVNRRNSLAALSGHYGLNDSVEFIGPYRQSDAPDIYRRADLLLHTQYNDVCPSVVLEAMATGLPVVYSASGGTPELVGECAGIGLPTQLDWNTPRPPSAEKLAEALLAVAENLNIHSEAARARAVEGFGLDHWIKRHRETFAEWCSK